MLKQALQFDPLVVQSSSLPTVLSQFVVQASCLRQFVVQASCLPRARQSLHHKLRRYARIPARRELRERGARRESIFTPNKAIMCLNKKYLLFFIGSESHQVLENKWVKC